MKKSHFHSLLTLSLLCMTANPFVSLSQAETAADQARNEIQQTFGQVPSFVNFLPEDAVPGAWEELRALELSETLLPAKIKSLIGVAVAAQIPCAYCSYFDTESAKQAGATEQEIKEAVAMAAITRHWSTILNGSQLNMAQFESDLANLVAHASSGQGQSAKNHKPVTDAQSAYEDIELTLGSVPSFFRSVPPFAIAGAWKEMKNVQMNPNTALSGKDKELIGLSVAAQIPCAYCVTAHTTFAKMNGATDAEIQEAVAVAALSRHWSTVANGSQIEMAKFKKEVDAMLKYAAKHNEQASR